MSVPYLVLAVVTLLSTLPGAYFSGLELRHPEAEVRRVARYLMVRSVALLVAALIPLGYRFDGWLVAMAVVMIVMPAADACLGWVQGRLSLTVGPAVTALVNGAALAWLLGS